jgi:hypothetical protein
LAQTRLRARPRAGRAGKAKRKSGDFTAGDEDDDDDDGGDDDDDA